MNINIQKLSEGIHEVSEELSAEELGLIPAVKSGKKIEINAFVDKFENSFRIKVNVKSELIEQCDKCLEEYKSQFDENGEQIYQLGKGEYEDLGMRNQGGWDNEVHENILVDGKTDRLQNMLIHDSNQSLSFWIQKQNEFSTWNAERRIQQLEEPIPPISHLFNRDPLAKRKFLKALYLRIPFKPAILFLYLYFLLL